MSVTFPVAPSFRDRHGSRLVITGIGSGEAPNVVWKVVWRIESNGRDLHAIVRSDVVDRMRQLQSDMTPGEIRVLPTDAGARLTVELVDAPPGPAVRLELTTDNEDRVAFELPTRQLGDVIEYASWIIDTSRAIPRIVARARVAHALAAPDASIEDAATRFAGLSDDEIVRVLMGLAARSRVDLAVTLLDRLSRAGRMRDLDTLPDADFYESERPRDLSWADLRRWSGANLTPNAVESIERRYREIARPYVPTDYIDCFETAFDEQFERIPFATLDVRDVQARLRRLDEYLDVHFDNVAYPPAEHGVIPHIVAQEQWTEALGVEYAQLAFTPAVWYEDARRLLLFATKVSFEDPLPQLVGPLASLINHRSYTYGDRRVAPARVHPTHIDELRRALTNAQRMARLIREGIVIPHSLRTARLQDYIDAGPREFRFRDEYSRAVASDLATTLGLLMSSGEADRFGLPEEIVQRAKAAVSGRIGGGQSLDWFYEFFETIASDDALPDDAPIRLWMDHFYRIALYGRYFDTTKLGYAPHFLHRGGYRIYELLEAADKVTAAVGGPDRETGLASEMEERLAGDRIVVSRLEALVRPKLAILSDADLTSIRLNEHLFEEWRALIKDALDAVTKYEQLLGREDPSAAAREIQPRLEKWQADSLRLARKDIIETVKEVTGGVTFSVVSSLVLTGEPEKFASLAAGAAWSLLRPLGRTFRWRKARGLFRRHSLSVM